MNFIPSLPSLPPIVQRATSPNGTLHAPSSPKTHIKLTNGTAKHVMFVTHGMGGYSDMRYDQLQQCYIDVMKEDFGGDGGEETEIYPIEWYTTLHGLESVDKRMAPCTLPTCGVLRRVNNEILADVLYYFTKFHGQTMVNIVTEKLNAAWKDFKSRNPQFNGRIALVGHSLGGVISYDIIANQPRDAPLSNSSSSESAFSDIKFPLLDFKPNFLFSMGSPMAAVMVMRGQEVEEYQLPKWCRYINVFHLFDPLGYRCEPLFDPSFASIPPMAIQRPSSQKSMVVSTFYSDLIRNYFDSTFSNLPSFSFPSWPSSTSLASMQMMTLPDPLPILTDFSRQVFGMVEALTGSAAVVVGEKRKRGEVEDRPKEVEQQSTSRLGVPRFMRSSSLSPNRIGGGGGKNGDNIREAVQQHDKAIADLPKRIKAARKKRLGKVEAAAAASASLSDMDIRSDGDVSESDLVGSGGGGAGGRVPKRRRKAPVGDEDDKEEEAKWVSEREQQQQRMIDNFKKNLSATTDTANATALQESTGINTTTNTISAPQSPPVSSIISFPRSSQMVAQMASQADALINTVKGFVVGRRLSAGTTTTSSSLSSSNTTATTNLLQPPASASTVLGSSPLANQDNVVLGGASDQSSSLPSSFKEPATKLFEFKAAAALSSARISGSGGSSSHHIPSSRPSSPPASPPPVPGSIDPSSPTTAPPPTRSSPPPVDKGVEKLLTKLGGLRQDFFVQENVIDNVVHQYFVGLKAHFMYWAHKDVVYCILKMLKDGEM